jgi:hypothetical protein
VFQNDPASAGKFPANAPPVPTSSSVAGPKPPAVSTVFFKNLPLSKRGPVNDSLGRPAVGYTESLAGSRSAFSAPDPAMFTARGKVASPGTVTTGSLRRKTAATANAGAAAGTGVYSGGKPSGPSLQERARAQVFSHLMSSMPAGAPGDPAASLEGDSGAWVAYPDLYDEGSAASAGYAAAAERERERERKLAALNTGQGGGASGTRAVPLGQGVSAAGTNVPHLMTKRPPALPAPLPVAMAGSGGKRTLPAVRTR